MNEKLPVSVKEACAILHCSSTSLYKWLAQGTVESTKIGREIEVWLPAEMIRKPQNSEPVRY